MDNGETRRPKSKKEVKEFIAARPIDVMAEQTSPYGNEYDGQVTLKGIEENGPILFVGPDPYTKRNFYGSIKINRKGVLTVE